MLDDEGFVLCSNQCLEDVVLPFIRGIWPRFFKTIADL